MSRVLLVAIVTLSWPMLSAAQSRAERPMALPVLPPIGLPLAPIGLPLPALGLPTTTSVNPRGPVPHDGGRGPSRGDRRHDGRTRVPFVYVVPGYGWPFAAVAPLAADTVVSSAAPAPAPGTAPSTFGRLHLEIDAADPVQVLVDGYYAGTLAELNSELEIEPGPHRLEFRAAGYEALAVDVRVPPSRSISYRGALTPLTPTAPDTPAPRSTIYFIPGCYLGNVHPNEISLPAGCDLSQLVIRKP